MHRSAAERLNAPDFDPGSLASRQARNSIRSDAAPTAERLDTPDFDPGRLTSRQVRISIRLGCVFMGLSRLIICLQLHQALRRIHGAKHAAGLVHGLVPLLCRIGIGHDAAARL
jgi:hypothetical protein